MDGLYLVEPHGRLIAEGKKTLIVKSKNFKNQVGKDFFLLSGGLAFGIIRLKAPQQISLEDFEKLREKHQISEAERKEWWSGKESFFAFPFQLKELFSPAKTVKIPRGAQTFVKDVKLLEDETEVELFIETLKLTPEHLEAFSISELMNAYSRARRLAKTTQDRETLYNVYQFILSEFKKRKIEMPEPAEELWLDKSLRSKEELGEVLGVSPKELTKIPDSDVRARHWRAHQLSANIDSIDKETLWVSHRRIVKEMERRNKARGKEDFKHNITNWLDKPFQGRELATKTSYNAPTLAYIAVYGKEPETFLPGRTDHPEKKWKGLSVDVHLKESWLNKLDSIEHIEMRSSCEGHSKDRISYIIFRLDPKYEKNSGWLSEKLDAFQDPDIYSLVNVGTEGRKRIVAAGKTWYGQKDWQEWWEKLPGAIEKTVGQVTSKIPLAEELAPILPSGERTGELIELEDILPYFKSFFLRDPLVLLTGGIVNRGKTVNDIELLLKMDEDEKIYIPTCFRLFRMLPRDLGERIHFLDDHFKGAFTDYIPLFRLKAEIYPQFQVRLMQESEKASAKIQASTSKRQDRIELFRHFFPLKGIEGYREGERYSIETAVSFFKPEDFPVIIQKKYDGTRNFIHKDNEKVKILSEEGVDVTSRFPKMVQELKAWKSPKQVILDSEFEKWEKKEHLGREWMAGYQNAKTPADDSGIVANVFDCLYFYSSGSKSNLNLQVGDLHKTDQITRLKYLDLCPFKQSTMEIPNPAYRLNKTPSVVAENPKELSSAIRKIARMKASEGAMIKPGDLVYPLSGMTSKIIKFKNMAEVHCIIEKQLITKTPGVYNYELCLGIPPGVQVDPKSIREIKGKKYTYVGRSYNTKTKAAPGQICTISFHTLNVYKNPRTGTVRLHLYEPRWYELRPTQTVPDNVTEAIQIAKEAGLFGEKVEAAELDIFSYEETYGEDALAGTPWDWRLGELDPDDYENWLDENSGFLFPEFHNTYQADPMMEIPPENKRHKFILQWHFRGKSLHTDWRMNISRYLVSWTLMDEKAGAIKEPVTTLEQAKALLEDFDEISKLNNEPGMRDIKVVAAPKARQPKIWFTLQGTTGKPEPGEKPPIGGTKRFPGVFLIFDRGRVEFGAQKTWFHEYWLHGKKFNGKWVVRYLPNIWKAKEPGREREPEMIWMTWKAKDEIPYVLRTSTVKEGWMPPLGVSALPEHIRKRVPKEYRYWEAKDSKAAKEVRDSLVLAIKKKQLKIYAEEVPYLLQYQFYKGQTVVRAGATSFFWRISFNFPNQVMHWMLYGNPLQANQMTALKKPATTDLLKLKGEIAPKTKYNPSKATPSFIRTVDQGKALFLENKTDFKKIKFTGGKLKGLWVFRQETPGEPVWLFERSKLPEVSQEDLIFLAREDLIDILERSEYYARIGS